MKKTDTNTMQKLASIKPVKKQAGVDGLPLEDSEGKSDQNLGAGADAARLGTASAPDNLPALAEGGKFGLTKRIANILAHGGKNGKKLGLRDLMFENEISPIDLEYMSEADAAIHRYGKPRAYLISLVIIVFFIAMLIWASLTKLDEITRAFGQVVPAQSIQEIQYLEGGVLEKLMVKQGDEVEAGQVLARISNVMAASALQE